jgi:hypothetical protein
MDTGTRLSTALSNIIKIWINAPAEVMAIHNEITDLTIFLDHLRSAGRNVEANTTLQDESLVKALNEELATAHVILTELETMLNQLLEMRKFKKGLKWIRQNPVMEKKKASLRNVKLRIHDLLWAHNL